MPRGIYKRKKWVVTKKSVRRAQVEKMRAIVLNSPVKFKRLVFEMFGDYTPATISKTNSIIGILRSRFKQEGKLFYSVKGMHQVIDSPEIFMEYVLANKDRVKYDMLALQESANIGILQFPEMKKEILKTMAEIHQFLLDNPLK